MTDSIESIIKELPFSKIYDELSKDASGNEDKIEHCNNLNDGTNKMNEICTKMAKNIKTLQNNSEMKDLSHRNRCTYLNFWIYGGISKLHKYENKNLTDITEIANLIDANIKINMDLIKDDFNKNKLSFFRMKPTKNDTSSQSPANFVKYYDLSKYNPCIFNYDCTFSECREMKHLYEYFKAYDKIKDNIIKCVKEENDKYFKYIKDISFLYNKHKEVCCSWGAEICTDYFLACDEYYDPNKLLSAIESGDKDTCNKIKNSSIFNLSEETSSIDPKDENNMYIKYFTCSYVTDSTFEEKGLRCQQPEYSPLKKNKFPAVRPVYKSQTNNSQLTGKKLTINGKSINAVLIYDISSTITREANSNTMERENYNTLFPEITREARKNYIKQAKEACKNGKPKKGMETYCKRSKRYKDIINGVDLQSGKHIELTDTQNLENVNSSTDILFINELLQKLPVRIGVVCLAALGTVIVFFMYYKFTPLGSWLLNVMRGRRKMKHGNNTESRKSLNYPQEDMSQISQKKRIKIAYQSS